MKPATIQQVYSALKKQFPANKYFIFRCPDSLPGSDKTIQVTDVLGTKIYYKTFDCDMPKQLIAVCWTYKLNPIAPFTAMVVYLTDEGLKNGHVTV